MIDRNKNLITVGTFKGEAAFGDFYLTADKNDHFIARLGSRLPDTYIFERQASKLNSSLKIYPNPLAEEGMIEFRLANPSNVGIDLFAIDGKYIQNVYNGVKGPGIHTVVFDIESIP